MVNCNGVGKSMRISLLKHTRINYIVLFSLRCKEYVNYLECQHGNSLQKVVHGQNMALLSENLPLLMMDLEIH